LGQVGKDTSRGWRTGAKEKLREGVLVVDNLELKEDFQKTSFLSTVKEKEGKQFPKRKYYRQEGLPKINP